MFKLLNISYKNDMNIDNIEINTQSSIRLEFEKVLYFDPFKIETNSHDADIIFITHEHFDHMDIESIEKIKKDNTIIVAPKSMENIISKIEFGDYIYLKPFDEACIYDINIKAIPAYNLEKQFHPRANDWLGYIITVDNITYYIAGDTDATEEAKNVKCDIALVPIGGYYTMDVDEAAKLIRIIKPKIVIPTHYGSIVGEKTFGKKLKQNLADTNIEVIEKLY